MALVWLSVAFILGVVIGSWLAVPAIPVIVLAIVILGGGYFARRHRYGFAAMVFAACLLGLARAPVSATRPGTGDVSYFNGRSVQVEGVVAAEPDIRDTGANYVIAVNHVTVRGRTRAVSGRIRVHTPRSQTVEYGHAVVLTGRLIEPRNSPALPYRDILAHQGIGSLMSFPRLEDRGAVSQGILGWIVPLRERLERGINSWLPEPEAALLIAITLGAHSASLGDLAPILVSTGLIHLIAISGIKVALIAGTLYDLARLTQRRLLALSVSLAGLAVYVLLTGATASGERSALMWALIFIGAYLGRGTLAIVSLSFVAAIMVAFDPTLPWDIGFQMSVIGTFAIVTFAEPIMRALRWIPSPLREAFGVTVAAQIGTLPVVIIGFHLVSLSSALANALVLPLLPLLVLLGFLLGAVSGLSIVAAPVGALAYALLRLIVDLSTWLATLPGAIPATVGSAAITAAYYAVLLSAALFVLRRVSWAPIGRWAHRGRELSLALVVGAATLTVPLVHADQPLAPRLDWLGTGGAILLRTSNETVLIDGSPRPFVLLQRLGSLLPYGTRSIDLVVVTDPRATNVAGLQAVLDHYTISEVIDVGAEYPSLTYARWRDALRSRKVPVYALRTSVVVHAGSVQMDSVGPDAIYPNPQDSIGLLRLQLPRYTILLAGSASVREQEEAVFRSVKLRADVLVIGGKKGYSPAFIRAIHPRLVFSSATAPTGEPGSRLRDGAPVQLLH